MATANPPIILDSSALVALSLRVDADHARAVTISEGIARDGRLVLVPEPVFVETMNVIGKRLGHAQALAVSREIKDAESMHVVSGEAAILRDALVRFATQPDSVSLTDCLVMAYADAWETQEIFGFDATFGKNDYRLPEHLPA
jgi:predicted nucleic acid-binding protein